MQDSQRKSTLINYIQAEHTQLENLLDTLNAEQMQQPGITGTWSVKDVLAHLIWWEQDLIKTIKTGEKIKTDQKEDLEIVDHANALIVERKRQTPLSDMLVEFHQSYQQLLQTITELTEDFLVHDDIYTYLLNHTGAHYTEHCEWIQAGFQQKSGSFAALLKQISL